MKRPKSVLLDLPLFIDMYVYAVRHAEPTDLQYERISAGVRQKINAMMRHELVLLLRRRRRLGRNILMPLGFSMISAGTMTRMYISTLRLSIVNILTIGPLVPDRERIFPGLQVLIVLAGRKLSETHLAGVIVVVINVIINLGNDLLVLAHLRDSRFNVILHVPKEALLRGIVPAIATARHRLYEFRILQLFDESVAGIMNALIAVNNGLIVQDSTMFLDQVFHRFQHKINLQVFAQLVRENLMCAGIQDR